VQVRQGLFTEATQAVEDHSELLQEADDEGHTLLHWAALAGNVTFATFAVTKGATVDAVSKNGQTPLMWSVITGMVGAARVLMEAKADAHAKDSMGATPFILAIQHRQHAAVMLLASLEPREKLLKAADVNGCSPVHWAAYKGDATSLKVLDYFDASFAALDEMKMTPLHRAVQASQVGVCEFLLEKEVDPSQVDREGRTCMDVAVANQDRVVRRTLDRLLEVSGAAVTMGDGRRDPEDPPPGATLRRRPPGKDEAAKFKEKAIHNAAATFWLVSVSLALFEYLTEQRALSWVLAPTVALGFELGVPGSLALFATVALSDPGKVPARHKGCSGVEDLVKAFRAGENPDFGRLCTTTWVLKGLRTKYCVRTGACVREFDHFCGWLNVAIGRGNHRPFIFLALTECFTQLCHLYLCWACAAKLVPTESIGSWAIGVVTGYPLLALVAIVHTFTAPGIVMLSLHQLRLIGVNLTTNETMNMPRYTHFWQEIEGPGGKKRVFHNPFHKGSVLRNFVDFWWTRRREDRGPIKAACACHNPHCKA